ncbi:MAG: tannase/feruloyl esterase family alpha/beta hydrolase [Nitrososphaeraceae archaeon]|nr:tannase/feruloyl esterase family alpha/beta hydrolase [Nitrososphaeraceae archaeon]MBV9669195.1 tannase/feruloyl esterase family alpha/beta hydrolase [Nitrososphaeraceae archaeon]
MYTKQTCCIISYHTCYVFMFLGAYHCGDGYGSNHFDTVSAITAWVEHRNAPYKIMAIQYSSEGGQL